MVPAAICFLFFFSISFNRTKGTLEVSKTETTHGCMCSWLLVQTQGQICSYHSQRGQKPSVRRTGTASWAPLSSAHADPDPLWASTSPRVTKTEPTSPCSATAARGNAGASTTTGRRSPGLAPGLEANQCVGGSHVYQNKPTASLSVNRKSNREMCLFAQDPPLILLLSVLRH